MNEFSIGVSDREVKIGVSGISIQLSPAQARVLGALLANFADMAEGTLIHVVRPLDNTGLEAVLDGLQAHGRLRAIKLYRQHTRADLRASRDAVDFLADEYGIKAGGVDNG